MGGGGDRWRRAGDREMRGGGEEDEKERRSGVIWAQSGGFQTSHLSCSGRVFMALPQRFNLIGAI